jgi:hydrogenase maturation protease
MSGAIRGSVVDVEPPPTVCRRASATDSERAASAPLGRTLVIGYGNELRGDDAAGALVARRLASFGLAATEVVVAPMLVPEMALDMAESHRVLFVDASVRCADCRVRLSPVQGTGDPPYSGCAYRPEHLAGLCEHLSGRAPRAWLLEVPAERFDWGGPLSMTTTRGIEQAVHVIRRWLAPRGHTAQPAVALSRRGYPRPLAEQGANSEGASAALKGAACIGRSVLRPTTAASVQREAT